VYYPFKTLSQVRLKKKNKEREGKNCEIKQSVSKMRKTDMHTHTHNMCQTDARRQTSGKIWVGQTGSEFFSCPTDKASIHLCSKHT